MVNKQRRGGGEGLAWREKLSFYFIIGFVGPLKVCQVRSGGMGVQRKGVYLYFPTNYDIEAH